MWGQIWYVTVMLACGTQSNLGQWDRGLLLYLLMGMLAKGNRGQDRG